MQDFVHLHVHTQYSLLDGQASVSRLVDKAMKDGMRGIAVTDHGNMFGIKEFTNYVNKKNGGPKGEIKDLKKKMADIESGKEECEDKEAALADCREKIAAAEARIFKPIIGCEMYVARRTMDKKEGKPDQSGYHLVVLAKNEKGYHNLIKLVSHAWTQGYYMRPRTDRNELEKYHEGLIVCSACLGGEIPKKITNDLYEEAEEAIRWYKNLFGDDFYLELQRHKATVPRANHEAYPMQQKVNAKLLEYSKKFGIKLICTNDVHFVDEENAEAHDRLICLSTGKDLDDPTRMLYTKQEWMKTKACRCARSLGQHVGDTGQGGILLHRPCAHHAYLCHSRGLRYGGGIPQEIYREGFVRRVHPQRERRGGARRGGRQRQDQAFGRL